MNITKLKQNLRELHPLTRIIKITDLIKRTEDKKLKEELNKLLEQTNKEIEHSSIFNLGALPQQSTHIEETQRPQEFQNLEQVLIQEPIIEKEENNADTSYRSSSSDYDKGYERQRELNYERERDIKKIIRKEVIKS